MVMSVRMYVNRQGYKHDAENSDPKHARGIPYAIVQTNVSAFHVC